MKYLKNIFNYICVRSKNKNVQNNADRIQQGPNKPKDMP